MPSSTQAPAEGAPPCPACSACRPAFAGLAEAFARAWTAGERADAA